MSAGFKLGPGIAAILTGLSNDWAANDNGRIVVVIRHEPLTDAFVIRSRVGEEALHTRSPNGIRTRSAVCAVHRRYLLPLCPEHELAVDYRR